MSEIISGLRFLDWLEGHGVIPRETRRVIIDAQYDQTLLIYVEQLGTIDLIEHAAPEVLMDAKLEILK